MTKPLPNIPSESVTVTRRVACAAAEREKLYVLLNGDDANLKQKRDKECENWEHEHPPNQRRRQF